MSISSEFQRFISAVKKKLNANQQLADALRGPKGYLLHVTNEPSQPLTARPVLNKNPIIVETQEEAQQHLGSSESFETVFNTWKRISHLGSPPYPSRPEELDSWALDIENNAITCTINSTSLVGFISPDRHENYVFEVILRSTTTDDDQIGICLAYTELDGKEHTIVAMRRTGGLQPIPTESVTGIPGGHRPQYLDVYYDIFHPSRIDMGSTSEGITTNTGGWAARPEGCRIRVTRTGDQFKVETTDLGSSAYIPSATVTFSLNDHPELAKFKGPQRYGYMAFSQPNASWETLKKPAVLNEVLVLGSPLSYQWDGSAWQNNIPTQTIIDSIPNGLMFYNQLTKKTYYKTQTGQITRVRSK